MTRMMKVPQTIHAVIENEREVIQLVSIGKTDYEIGVILGKAASTIAHRISVACRVADVSNRTHLACEAIRRGWIT